MLSQFNLTQISTLQPAVRPLAENLLRLAADRGIPLRVVSAYRTPAEQQILFESGAGVTKASALMSYHNHGLAFDVVPVSYLPMKDWNPEGPLWADVGALGKSLGLTWGGDWTGEKKDRPHFQLTAAPIRELKSYYEKFKTIMPISITPTTGGAIMALIVLAVVGWLYREHL